MLVLVLLAGAKLRLRLFSTRMVLLQLLLLNSTLRPRSPAAPCRAPRQALAWLRLSPCPAWHTRCSPAAAAAGANPSAATRRTASAKNARPGDLRPRHRSESSRYLDAALKLAATALLRCW